MNVLVQWQFLPALESRGSLPRLLKVGGTWLPMCLSSHILRNGCSGKGRHFWPSACLSHILTYRSALLMGRYTCTATPTLSSGRLLTLHARPGPVSLMPLSSLLLYPTIERRKTRRYRLGRGLSRFALSWRCRHVAMKRAVLLFVSELLSGEVLCFSRSCSLAGNAPHIGKTLYGSHV